jgi:hypothetical protein
MEPSKPNSPKKHMGHNFPYKKGLYHQRIFVIEFDASPRGLEKTPMILDL